MIKKRLKIHVRGRVQGVGFRPTVYRYARDHSLSGWVSNTSSGVFIEIEGKDSETDAFLKKLKSSPPPLARISGIAVSEIPSENDGDFRIVPSESGEVQTEVSPDAASCADCRKELLDPSDRRYRYPFINCTNCGPRFSIVKDIPYDRKNTTMSHFTMCPDCRREYEDPADRRFHAQPDACPVCGPQLELVKSPELNKIEEKDEALKETVKLLASNHVLAIKGLGGFHLACNALSDDAVKTLRKRKYRYDKPFALMARNMEVIRKYCEVSEKEEALLKSPAAPIVLLRKKDNQTDSVSDQVAPHNQYLGFMLPYTPLHILLFESEISVLVMTSGNTSREPIAFDNDDAFRRLKHIADYFLIHNRPIYTRCDDSVTRVFQPVNREMPLRRSRGYAPSPLTVPFQVPATILSCGAHLNNTFALSRNGEIYPSHHIGDLENLEALRAFESGIEHFCRLFEMTPELVVHDMHPDYLSTKYARGYSQKYEINALEVQHHHAHVASCMADNQRVGGPVIGVSLDGTGYGTDGTIWGGEFLVADYATFTRAGHLNPVPLPGGEMAIRQPWRMGAVYLEKAFGEDFTSIDIPFTRELDLNKWKMVSGMIKNNIHCPLTSSMGRLFSAVSSIIGVRETINYEGQAAIELETAIGNAQTEDVYNYNIREEKDSLIIHPEEIIREIVQDIRNKKEQSYIAVKFHNTVAKIILDMCRRIRQKYELNVAALSGGVFQNIYLLERVVEILKENDFEVLVHNRVPPNDGGIAFGQSAIASALIKKGEQNVPCCAHENH